MSEEFKINQNGINPKDVPLKLLNSGHKMPSIGIGTFGSDLYSAEQISDAVMYAAGFGQRSFDCASVYGNEKQIGEAFQLILDGVFQEMNYLLHLRFGMICMERDK